MKVVNEKVLTPTLITNHYAFLIFSYRASTRGCARSSLAAVGELLAVVGAEGTSSPHDFLLAETNVNRFG